MGVSLDGKSHLFSHFYICMNLFPENKYLSISQKPAWDLLQKLENEDLGKLTDQLTENLFS